MLAIRIVSLFGVAVPFSIAISGVIPLKPGELSKPFTTPLDTVVFFGSYGGKRMLATLGSMCIQMTAQPSLEK